MTYLNEVDLLAPIGAIPYYDNCIDSLDKSNKNQISLSYEPNHIVLALGEEYFISQNQDIMPFRDMVDDFTKPFSRKKNVSDIELLVSGKKNLSAQDVETGWHNIWNQVKNAYVNDMEETLDFIQEHKGDIYMGVGAFSMIAGGTAALILGADSGIGSLVGVSIGGLLTKTYMTLNNPENIKNKDKRKKLIQEHKGDIYMGVGAFSMIAGGTTAAILGTDTGIGSLIGASVGGILSKAYVALNSANMKNRFERRLEYCDMFQNSVSSVNLI